MEKITVAQVFAVQQFVDELDSEKDRVREVMTAEIGRADQKYRDQIWDLEREKREVVGKLEAARDDFVRGMEAKIVEHYAVIKRVQRILECFRMPTARPLTIPDEVKLGQYAFQFQECLGYLVDDDMLKVKIFIVGNRKPKNHLTLVAIGRSIFTEPLIKFPQGYGLEIDTFGHRNSLELGLRDAGSAEELKEYYARHKSDILKPAIDEYQAVKAEYLDTMSTYKLTDFELLISWRCPKCNNFRTTYESDTGYRSDEAPQCYHHDPYVKMEKTIVYDTTQKLTIKV